MSDFFNQALQKLVNTGIKNPRLEIRLLLAAVLRCSPSFIFSDVVLTSEQKKLFDSLLAQRLQHKPIDKILKHREFYKADFMVDENVLSPRADTEILVEEALRLLPNENVNILDLGTGSGCIIESILLEKDRAIGVAVDISERSLIVAQKNADALNLNSRLNFIRADWFDDKIVKIIGQEFDMIISNPPYIPTGDIAALMPEVKNYDPLTALDGGSDGYDSYKRIAEIAPHLLKYEGYLLLEAGYGQAQKIVDICTVYGLIHHKTVADLNGIARCVIMQKPSH